MMGAARLREAARLMRLRAQAAERSWPSPWYYHRGEVHHSDFKPAERAYNRPYVCAPDGAFINADGTDADKHIAGMDPAVALAVADLLDEEAALAALAERLGIDEPEDSAKALAVADAYLGTTHA